MDQKSFSIAPGHKASDWRKLALDPDAPESADWTAAVRMFRDRIERRFFAPADVLIASEHEECRQTFGFAILALDCLVIETLQGFREGMKKHNGKSQELFCGFLTNWPVFTSSVPEDEDVQACAKLVYTDCRCALLHSGSTDGLLRVGVTGKAFAFGKNKSLKINRTKLHDELKRAFTAYLEELVSADARQLRVNFKKKMDAICGVE